MKNERVERFVLSFKGLFIHATNLKLVSNSIEVYFYSYYVASLSLVSHDLEFAFFHDGTAFYNVVEIEEAFYSEEEFINTVDEVNSLSDVPIVVAAHNLHLFINKEDVQVDELVCPNCGNNSNSNFNQYDYSIFECLECGLLMNRHGEEL